jgi:hypothetical protein
MRVSISEDKIEHSKTGGRFHILPWISEGAVRNICCATDLGPVSLEIGGNFIASGKCVYSEQVNAYKLKLFANDVVLPFHWLYHHTITLDIPSQKKWPGIWFDVDTEAVFQEPKCELYVENLQGEKNIFVFSKKDGIGLAGLKYSPWLSSEELSQKVTTVKP